MQVVFCINVYSNLEVRSLACNSVTNTSRHVKLGSNSPEHKSQGGSMINVQQDDLWLGFQVRWFFCFFVLQFQPAFT